MIEDGSKLKLSLDLDDTTTETTAHMQQVHEVQFPDRFPPDLYRVGSPDKIFQKEFYDAWQLYHRTSWLIPHLPFCDGSPWALSIFAEVYEVDLNSARQKNQEEAVVELFVKHNLSGYITSFCLRPVGEEDLLFTKLKTVEDRGSTDVAEDNPIAAVWLAGLGKRVIVPERPWNQGIPNGPNLRKYKNLKNYALDLIRYGSPVQVFTMHRQELDDPSNLYRVH